MSTEKRHTLTATQDEMRQQVQGRIVCGRAVTAIGPSSRLPPKSKMTDLVYSSASAFACPVLWDADISHS
jgi:hypothetical protein